MDRPNYKILFALLRSAICGTKLGEFEIKSYTKELLPKLIEISKAHDVEHLLLLGLSRNGLISKDDVAISDKLIFKAVYRYEQLNAEYGSLCSALDEAKTPYIPLKGSVLRKYYPEPWMRTSCDIDILVGRENLDETLECLVNKLKYIKKEIATHDVSLLSPQGVHVELHFDLIEEDRANNAISVLESVWENVYLCEGSDYRYEMTDEFFYFYHIAHMAKHFETGGCGIRPFIDLWILDHIEGIDENKRNELLSDSGLLQFANVCRKLSRVWFGDEKEDDLSLQMQGFILHGGVYGSSDNRVALQQKKKGGRIGYIFSRLFLPYSKLKRYYPVLEKHRYLTPIMQVRRWFMLFDPSVARMAKSEIAVNSRINKDTSDEMNRFLGDIGLK